ncbi:MAG: hypothetical protein Q4G36_08635 [Paracoccus sp. (in: a-proteobacteria)]|nr:hypothetical protein [Paracoccus sp. (in: a-proteobacteria)]
MTRFADVDSDTPHGPRRVPQGHIATRDRLESRAVPPSGEVDAEGRRAPAPSMTTKVMLIGGASVAAVALTAGTLLAGRKIIEAIGGSDEDDKPARRGSGRRDHAPFMPPVREARAHAPRFAAMDADERAEMRERAEARARAERRRVAELRARAARGRDNGNMINNISDSAERFTGSIGGLMASLTSAVGGFRSVAGQAGGLLSEFSNAADTVRSILGGGSEAAPSRPFRGTDRADTGRRHAADGQEADGDDRRAHRL